MSGMEEYLFLSIFVYAIIVYVVVKIIDFVFNLRTKTFLRLYIFGMMFSVIRIVKGAEQNDFLIISMLKFMALAYFIYITLSIIYKFLRRFGFLQVLSYIGMFILTGTILDTNKEIKKMNRQQNKK